jgi:bacterioferritin-associated ferredoxin
MANARSLFYGTRPPEPKEKADPREILGKSRALPQPMLKVVFKCVMTCASESTSMIVCLCKGVSCGTVRQVIGEGAMTVEEVGRACGAGTDCGGCQGAIEDLIDREVTVASCERRSLPVIRAA